MGVFIGPRLTTDKRASFVPAPGELIYDTDLGIYFIGNGIAVGGRPVVVKEGLDYPTGGVIGPKGGSKDFALVLFEGTGGKGLRDGPSLGSSGMALLSQGPGKEPVFGFPSLADLRVATENTGNVVIFTQPGDNTKLNGGLSLGRVPISSLALAGDKGQVLTSNGTGTLTPPSYQDPQNGFVRINIHRQAASPNAAFEITRGLNAKYDTYLLVGTNIKPAGALTPTGPDPTFGTPVDIFFQSGGTWWVSPGNKKYLVAVNGGTGATADAISLSLSKDVSNVGVDSGCTIKMYMFNPGVSDLYTTFMIDYVALHIHRGGALMTASSYFGCTTDKASVTGIRIKFKIGDIGSGTFTLYGLDKGKLPGPERIMQ